VSVFFTSISILSFASGTELALAKRNEGMLVAGKPQSYELVLDAGVKPFFTWYEQIM
jgi:hypothetical protein